MALKKSSKRTLRIVELFGTVAALLAISIFIYYYTGIFNPKKDSSVVATVGKDKIYISDYNERLFASTGRGTPQISKGATEGEKSSILYQLIDMKILERELAKRKITLDEDMLVLKAKEKYKDYDSRDDAVKKAYRNYVKLSFAEETLKQEIVMWKEGYIIFCRFDRADQDDMKNKPDAKAKKDSHREYAEKYCNDMKARLEQGKTNYNQEVDNVLKDFILGQSIWKPYVITFTESFGKDKFAPTDFQYAYNEYEQIKKLDSSQKSFYQILVKDINGVDSAYAVVSFSGKGGNGETTDFDKWFMDQRDQSQIKTYMERIK